MTITINFTYPIQDSVSVGDTAYYVYTNEDGGFDINSANIVEIGEIIQIVRQGPNGGYIVCETDLAANQMEQGCEQINITYSQSSQCIKAIRDYQTSNEDLQTMIASGASAADIDAQQIIVNTYYNIMIEMGCATETVIPCDRDPFILFSKNNCQNLKSLLGYYARFRFVNTSKTRAELFNITVDTFESSK